MADELSTDEFLEDLVLRGRAAREYTVANVRWRLRVLDMDEYRDLYARAGGVDDAAQRTAGLQLAILGAALTHVNDVPCSSTKAAEVVDKLPQEIVDALYDRYAELEDEYRGLIRDPTRLQALVDDHFSRVRFKVMKAVGALPTEERCRRMSDVQWMWFYMNILKDAKEEAEGTRDKLDYLAWFINPEQMQRVQERRKWEESGERKPGQAYHEVRGDREVVYHEERVNDSFERELAQAMGDEKGVELPDAQFKGNPNESKDEFIARALGAQAEVRQYNDQVLADAEQRRLADEARQVAEDAEAAGVDPGQVDFVEVSHKPVGRGR